MATTGENYTLYRGDCLEIMPTLEAGSVDAIITDLPYGTTACSWDVVIPFAPMWEQVKRVLQPRGAFVTTASQPFTSMLIVSNLDWFKYSWYWEKPKAANFSAVQWQPLRVIEEILVFSNGTTTYTNGAGGNIVFNPQKIPLEKPYKRDFRGNKSKSETTFLRNQNAGIVEYTHLHPRNLLYASTDGDGRIHPTQKPVALYEYLIRTYTNPSDTVLDFTMGSGTTGVAAIQTGRKFIGIEKDAEYFKIAEKRIHEATLQPQLFTPAMMEKPKQDAML